MNRFEHARRPLTWFSALLLTAFVAGCGGSTDNGTATSGANTFASSSVVASTPNVVSSSPSNNVTNIPTSTHSNNNIVTGATVSATFSEQMDPATINASTVGAQRTFTLKETTGSNIPGTVAMDVANTMATFTPTAAALTPNTNYTATITTAARSAGGIALANPVIWNFTTKAVASTGQAPIILGKSANFVILAKTGISTVPNSLLTGDIGVSPISHTAMTGFSETADSSNTFSTSAQVVGKMYAANFAAPTPTYMTTSVSDMETAYTAAAGRTLPDHTELGSGQIGGLTLAPGLYKWGTDVGISTDVTLSGGPNDVWIFQVSGKITQATATNVILAGGALAKNVFWQSGDAVTIEASAHFEGIVLSQTLIALKTNASANGRLLAQTAVTLDHNKVTQPAP
ncbi:MAG: ice-binding family protein [Burkholderiaceae bacterium]